MNTFILIIIVAVVVTFFIMLEPKFDITKEKELLLWYNDNKTHSRKFIKIF